MRQTFFLQDKLDCTNFHSWSAQTRKETTEENEDACFGHIVKSVKECREGEDEIMKYYSSHEFFEEGKKEGREES